MEISCGDSRHIINLSLDGLKEKITGGVLDFSIRSYGVLPVKVGPSAIHLSHQTKYYGMCPKTFSLFKRKCVFRVSLQVFPVSFPQPSDLLT